MKELVYAECEKFCIVSGENEFKPFVVHNDVRYNCNGLKTADGAQLDYSLWNDAFRLRETAKVNFNAKSPIRVFSEDEEPQPQPQPEPKPEAKPQPQPQPEPQPQPQPKKASNPNLARKTALSALETLLAESVSQINEDAILENLKPQIDEYIKATYGNLPKVVEIKTEKGEIRKVSGTTHYLFQEILKLVNNNEAVFLSGPAGCGKNVLCEQIAQALGLEFEFMNAITQEYQITGFVDGFGKFHDTPFYNALKYGRLLMLDEIDSSVPEVLIKINATLANGFYVFPNNERVDAHENFRVIAAGNTYGTGADDEYTGRFQLDASSLDRFFLERISYDENIEKIIAGNDMEIVNFIHDLRNAIAKVKIKHVVSYRAIKRMAKMKNILSPERIVEGGVLTSMSKDDIKYVAQNLEGDTKWHKAVRKLAKA